MKPFAEASMSPSSLSLLWIGGDVAAVLYPVAVVLTRGLIQRRLYCVQGPVDPPVADAVEAWMVF